MKIHQIDERTNEDYKSLYFETDKCCNPYLKMGRFGTWINQKDTGGK